MAKVSVYLNFPKQTEEAFMFYKEVFNGEFTGQMMRIGEAPPQEDMPPIPEEDKNLIMHIELTIMDGFKLMGTDAPDSMGFTIIKGNNVSINLEPDSKEEAKILFTRLAEGGKVTMPLQDMYWGAYYGSCTDKYGVQWMLNVPNKNV